MKMKYNRMNNIATHSRIVFLDYLRAIATIAVVCVHSIQIDNPCLDTTSWYTSIIYGSIFRWCVPIFVMISGTLFLDNDKTISIKTLYKKNILKLIIALAIWSIIYAIFQYFTIEKYHNIESIIGLSIIGHYHLWFLYMIIGIYIALPVLKLLSHNSNIIRYFLIISFIFSFTIPLITDVIYYSLPKTAIDLINTHPYFIDGIHFNYKQLTPQTMMGYSFYFFLGHYLNTKKNAISILWILFIGICGFALTAIPTLILSKDNFCGNYFHYLSIGPFLEAYAIFIVGKCFWIHKSRKLISTIINKSFGIYLIHPMIIETLFLINVKPTMINPIIGIPVFIILVFILSISIVYYLSKIPWFNRFCL